MQLLNGAEYRILFYIRNATDPRSWRREALWLSTCNATGQVASVNHWP